MDANSSLVQIGRPANSLAALPVGTSAFVSGLGGAASNRLRLLELGFTSGTAVRVVRRAPLGDPTELELRGYRLSLGASEARNVRVAAERPAPAMTPMAVTPSAHPRRSAPPSGLNIALLGNPNCGKSTLFNALSGRAARTGNYPGITVARSEATIRLPSGRTANLVDLPGCYSLIGRSPDEDIAALELLGSHAVSKPWDKTIDLALCVLDATALERSLGLVLQVLETGLPVVCALNLSDEARHAGLTIDVNALAQALGAPVIETVAVKEHGLDALLQALDRRLDDAPLAESPLVWPEPLQRQYDAAHTLLGPLLPQGLSFARERSVVAHWAGQVEAQRITAALPEEAVAALTQGIASARFSEQLTEARFAWIDAQRFVKRPAAARARLTDRIDALLTHPLTGAVVLLALLGVVFTALFTLADPVMGAIEQGFAVLAEHLKAEAPGNGLVTLLADGVLGGVGTVLMFLPQIALLLFFMTYLEGLGYLSRAAFLVDRLMRAAGLNGKAFVPMLSGYSCAVPAILSLRTLDNARDRLITLCVIPLMSCSARLPIYTLIIAILYPAEVKAFGVVPMSALLLLGLYVASAIVAIGAAAVLSRTRFKGESVPLVLELPPYRLPKLADVLRTVIGRSRDFLTTAGTTIVVLSAVMWLLLHFPRAPEGATEAQQIEQSFAGSLGHAIEPVVAPLGFDWKIGIGLIGSFAAREVFVATMGVVYGTGDDNAGLVDTLRAERRPSGAPLYSARTGFALLVFFMLACQCMSTLAVIRRETRSWRWPAFVFGYMTALAYLAALAINQIGALFA